MPVPDRRPPRRLVRELVYERFRDGIISGELAPGARLDDGWLQEWLDASRTPVREAIGRLGREGLLDVRPQRGTHVAPLDAAALLDRLAVITALIVASTAEAVPLLTEDDDAELTRLEAALEDAPLSDPVVLEPLEFFVARYGNRLLVTIVDNLLPHLRRALVAVSRADDGSRAVPPVRSALAAARRRDREATTDGLRAHLDEVADLVRTTLGDGSTR